MTDPAALLAAVRAGASLAPPAADERPRDAFEAVRCWLADERVRPGGHRTPPAGWLAEVVSAWCTAQGWDFEVSAAHVSAELLAAGHPRYNGSRHRGYRAHRDSARRLWALVRERHPEAPRRPPQPRRTAATPARRVTRPPDERPLLSEAPPQARPLLDSLGRVWPSASVAARLLRARLATVQRAATARGSALGVHWRQLTPDEVRLLPPGTRAGDTVPLCWHGCCLASGRGPGREVP